MSLYKKAESVTIFHCFEIEVTFIYIGIHPLGLRDIYKSFISTKLPRAYSAILQDVGWHPR